MSDKEFGKITSSIVFIIIGVIVGIIIIMALNWSKCSIKVGQNFQNYANIKVDGNKYQYSCISETDNPETGEHIVEIHFITKE